MNHKYIFVIGGVMSGVGKGIAAASLAKVLQAKGHTVDLVKVDPYLNVDAGTMNPVEHGEAFVLNSGLETDQDMGNYERFLNKDLPEENYLTSGMIYKSVIERERNLGYKGKCVEAIPHIRNEIIDRFKLSAKKSGADITVIEIGGTVGDYQNIMFIEAARVMYAQNPDDVMFSMVTYLPIPSKVGEMKTKPTQNAIRQLNSYGVQPHMVIGRSSEPLDERRKQKIALQCNIRADHVISAPDVDSIYDIPMNFERDNIGVIVAKQLKLPVKRASKAMEEWQKFVKKTKNTTKEINIAVVGKYFDTGDVVLSDAYISVIEAIKFSSYTLGAKPKLHWLSSHNFETGKMKTSILKKYDGIIVPGGFGKTGIEGKIKVIQYARENKIPYLGLCYGMQLMVVEYARNVAGLTKANTFEINPDGEELVIDIMEEQKEKMKNKDYGGTMRLGQYPAYLKRGTIARRAYKAEIVNERHRHRYEVNPKYVTQLEDVGLVFSGVSPDNKLMEIAELNKKEHPFMLGTQFHPELQARPLDPSPVFTAFVKAVLKEKKK